MTLLDKGVLEKAENPEQDAQMALKAGGFVSGAEEVRKAVAAKARPIDIKDAVDITGRRMRW